MFSSRSFYRRKHAYMKTTIVEREKIAFRMHILDPDPRTIVHFGLWDMDAVSLKCPVLQLRSLHKAFGLFTFPSPLRAFSNARPALILTSNVMHKFRLKSYRGCRCIRVN